MTWDFLTHRQVHEPRLLVLTPFSERAIKTFPELIQDLDPYRSLKRNRNSVSLKPDERDYVIDVLTQPPYNFVIKPWHKHQREALVHKKSSSRPKQSMVHAPKSGPTIGGAESEKLTIPIH